MQGESRGTRRRCGIRARLISDEAGLSLVESVMALVLVVILFVGVATTLQVAIRHQRNVRAQQQAAALALEYVEYARSLGWDVLELSEDPPASVPYVSSGIVQGSAFDLDADELLVIDAVDGGVDPDGVGTETINSQVFDVFQYVSDAGTGLRRYIVLIEWDTAGTSHSYFTSTQMSEVGSS